MEDRRERTSTQRREPLEADLGVLFVHGIGQQHRGDSLLAIGEALHEWIARWFTEGEDARGTTTGVLSQLASDPDAPAHVYTEMSTEDEQSTWLLAESLWAESFPPPTFNDLAVWGFQVMPWTLTSHFGTRARRGVKRAQWSRGWRRVWSTSRLTTDIVLLLLSFVVLVPLVLLIGLLALIGAIPIRWLRSLVGRIQRALSSSLGDSYVLLTSAIIAAAIEDTVRRDLNWLAARCARVAVVAHSQGAAISHRVLRGDVPSNVELLISVGSGLNKLDEIDRAKAEIQREQKTPREGSGLPYLGSIGLALIGYAVWQAMNATDPDFVIPFVIGATGLGLLLYVVVKVWRGYPPTKLDEIALPPSVDWVDMYASADPVPNGPLFDPKDPPLLAGPQNSRDAGVGFAESPRSITAEGDDEVLDTTVGSLPRSAVVHNRGSVLKDHSDYWRNRDGFMGAVAHQLSNLGGPAGFANIRRSDVTRLGVAARRRRWRVRWLEWIRTVMIVIAVAVPLTLVLRDDLQAVGLPVTGAVEWVLNLFPAYSDTQLGEGTTDIAAVISLLVAAFLVFIGLQWLWRWWGYVETHRLYRRLPYEGVPLQALILAASLVLVVEASVLTAAGFSADLAAGLFSAAVATVSSAVAVVVVGSFADRGLEWLWRQVPGDRSLIGPPAIPASTRLAAVVSVIALILFPAAVLADKAADVAQLIFTAWALLLISALLILGMAWNTRPIYEMRRTISRRSHADEVNLAQLRHSETSEDKLALLNAAAAELVETLEKAERDVKILRRGPPEIGSPNALAWRSLSVQAHEAARSTVDVYDDLVELDNSTQALEILSRGTRHCARATVKYVNAASLDDAAARKALDSHVHNGPRRDRRIARRALRKRKPSR